jgi:hypothetical protein
MANVCILGGYRSDFARNFTRGMTAWVRCRPASRRSMGHPGLSLQQKPFESGHVTLDDLDGLEVHDLFTLSGGLIGGRPATTVSFVVRRV